MTTLTDLKPQLYTNIGLQPGSFTARLRIIHFHIPWDLIFCCHRCRRMYDAIVQEAGDLPAGVQLVDVVRHSDHTDLKAAAAAGTVTCEQVSAVCLVLVGEKSVQSIFRPPLLPAPTPASSSVLCDL